MSDATRPRISKRDFRSWLLDRQDAVIGLAGDRTKCPLARYLSERWGARVEADPWTISLMAPVGVEPLREYVTPAWASDFILGVDRGANFGAPITGRGALAILEAIADSPPTAELLGQRAREALAALDDQP